MKKYLSLLLITIFFISACPISAFAYTGGLLNGKKMNLGNSKTNISSTTNAATDNDESTSYVSGASGSDTSYLWYDFATPQTIGAYAFKGSDNTLTLEFYDSSGILIGSQNANAYSGKRNPVVNLTKNVSKVVLRNETAKPLTVYEFDLFVPFDYSGGLLDGVSSSGDVVSTAATDNNEGSTLNLPAMKRIIYTLPSVSDIKGFRLTLQDASKPLRPRIDFKNASGTVVGSLAASTSVQLGEGSLQSINFAGVKTIELNNDYSSSPLILKEFNVYGPPPTPTTAVPNGLTATPGDSKVTLTWTANTESDLKGYNIYQDGTKIAGPITGTSFVVASGLTNGVSYNFKISSVNTSGIESAQTAAVTATPIDLTPPAVPKGLQATASTTGDGKVTLTWTANTESDLKGYNIYQDGTKIAGPITGTSYTATGLTVNTSYNYTISAVRLNGNESAQSSTVTAKPVDLTPPAVPTGISATIGDKKATLTWTANTESDLKGYNVYQDGTKIAGPITGTTYTINGLTNGTNYIFTISAVRQNGNESAKSAGVTAKPANVIPPLAPTGLSASADDSTVTLTWKANTESDLKGYFIYKEGVKIAGPITGTSYVVASGLTNGITYNFTVTAVNTSDAESGHSNMASAKPIKTKPPTVPKGLSVTPSDKKVTLTWTANTESDLKGYNIYQNGTKIAGPITSTSYIVNNLVNDTAYSFAISAIDTSGLESAKSAPIVAKPLSIQPPTAIKGTPVNNQISLTWTAPAIAPASYNIYRDGVKIGTSTTPAYSDPDVEPGKTYKYEISSVAADGRESTKANQGVYFSTAPIDFGTDSGFSVLDVLKSSTGIISLFVGFVLLVLAIKFAPQIWKFINEVNEYGRKQKRQKAAARRTGRNTGSSSSRKGKSKRLVKPMTPEERKQSKQFMNSLEKEWQQKKTAGNKAAGATVITVADAKRKKTKREINKIQQEMHKHILKQRKAAAAAAKERS